MREYAAIEKENLLLENLRQTYTDSVFISDLSIPEERIHDFMNYFAEDFGFNELVETDDMIEIWDFIQLKSIAYRKNNELDR